MLAGPLRLVVLQSTGFCNIDCSYCYLPDRGDRSTRMSPAVLAKTAELIFSSAVLTEALDIVWHAGEPLTLGVDYYREAVGILEKARPRKVALRYGVQTNAMLLSDDWIDLFEEYHFSVGVSLDGPADLHDAHRRDRAGRGTHARVLDGVCKLQRRNYPFHFIGVVTAAALARGPELFDFYAGLAPTAFGLNVEEVEAQNRRSTLFDGIDRGRYENFLTDLVSRACAAGAGQTVIREFQHTMSTLLAGDPEDNDLVVPLRILNVGWNGDLSTFSPELMALDSTERRKFIFGNVQTCGALEDLLEDARFISAFAGIRRGIERCERECEYFAYCGGGAPVNKLSEKGTLEAAETLYCQLTKKSWIDVCLRLAENPASRFDFVPAE